MRFALLISLIFGFAAYSLAQSYNGIRVQGMVNMANDTDLDIEFTVVGLSDDTLWQEQHNNIILTGDKTFDLILGEGILLDASVSSFDQLNWLQADRIDVRRVSGTGTYLILSLELMALPYAMHSMYILETPAVVDLSDFGPALPALAQLIKFDGTLFSASVDLVEDDTTLFAQNTFYSPYADTADVCLVDLVWVDSANYAMLSNSSVYTDTANYVLTATNSLHAINTNTVDYALNNWSFAGNGGVDVNEFIGSTNSAMYFKTNNTSRLVFYNDDTIGTATPYDGFGFTTKNGFLVKPTTASGLSSLGSGSFLYFNGAKSAFAGGYHNVGFDTAMATGSFVWGTNISASKGNYATMFGENISADSSNQGGIWYQPESSFAFGRNIVAGQYCVAFGENVKANYTRNVGIGKNVTVGTSSAGIGMGQDILITGSTSWAIGRNLTATGHFSTLMGYNMSTGVYRGNFMFGDTNATTAYPTANHQFIVRAAGGVIFYTSSDLSTGVELLPGAGSWNMLSDRNKKENIFSLDYEFYRRLFFEMPVYQWTYLGQPVVHLGPMAQDFNSLFHVGELPNYINGLDIDGVTLLGIKAVNGHLNTLLIPEKVEALEQNIQLEKEQTDSLELRINALYEKLDY